VNTPYPELTIDVTQRLRDFAAWNAAVEKSRREYRVNPIAACGVSGCPRLRYAGRMCVRHSSVNVRRSA
jgi:hypothetical protein